MIEKNIFTPKLKLNRYYYMPDIGSFIVEYLWLITLAIQIIIIILHGVLVKINMQEIDLKSKKLDDDEKKISSIAKKKEKHDKDIDNVKAEVDNEIEQLKNEFSTRIAEHENNQKTLINTIDSLVLQIKNMDEDYVKSLNEILHTVELSEQQKQELTEKLNALKTKLKQSRDEEHENILEEYNKLKAKLTEDKE